MLGRGPMPWRKLASALLVASTCAACGGGEDPNLKWDGDGPGSKAWGDPDVGCETDDQCAQGETCQQGVCQMQRCTGDAYESVAPLGVTRYFHIDREVVVVGDQSYIDGYESADGGYLASWDLGGAKVVDVAGGDLFGTRPHAIAAAIEFSEKVLINTGTEARELDVGIWPESLAVGDADADGIDELVVLGKDGSIALCNAIDGSCLIATLEGAAGVSAAIADVDGDGFEEPIFLVDYAGKSGIVVWNTDSEKTAQEQTLAWEFNTGLTQIAAADVNGDGIAEIMALEDGGLWDYSDDTMHVFSVPNEAIVTSATINGHTIDVGAGDRDGDGKAEVALLRDDGQFELLAADAEATFTSLMVTPLAVGASASRIATLDWDGDSASGRLVAGPELVAGSVVPVAVMLFPPYDRILQTKGSGNVTVGNTDIQSETTSDTVSLHLGLTVGWGGDLFSVVKGGVNAYLIKDWAATKSVTKSLAIGTRWSMDADPKTFGDDYGGVVLSCGCFHQYNYETDDPSNKVGGSGQQIAVLVPVGGQTGLWSSKRYNAVAEKVGGLPIINVPFRVGSIDSYPAEHQTLARQPIPDEDRVFVTPPTYQASDIGSVGWSLSIGEHEANTQSQTTTMGMNASVGAFGFTVSGDTNMGFNHAYTVAVGTDALFAGGIPPMQDDPSTPEDEYETYRYNFAPMVYREHYADAAGEDAGFYVITYAAGR